MVKCLAGLDISSGCQFLLAIALFGQQPQQPGMTFDRAYGINVPMTPNIHNVQDLPECQLAKSTPSVITPAAYSIGQT